MLCEELGRGTARLCEREREAAALREGAADPLAARAERRGGDVGEAVDGRAVDGEEREARGELKLRVAERELVRQDLNDRDHLLARRLVLEALARVEAW